MTFGELIGVLLAKLHHVTRSEAFRSVGKAFAYLISISLNVVSIAQVFWASFRRSAIFKRMRVIFTRVSERVPVILFGSVLPKDAVEGGAGCFAGLGEICEVAFSRCGALGGSGTDGALLGAAPLVSLAGFGASSCFFSGGSSTERHDHLSNRARNTHRKQLGSVWVSHHLHRRRRHRHHHWCSVWLLELPM